MVAFAALFVTILFKGQRLTLQSRAYANASATAILKGWDQQALIDRASPQLKASVKSESKLHRMFEQWRRLGEFEKWDGCIGAASVALTPEAKAVVTATCIGKAEFAHGAAKVKFALVQEDGAWRILGFGLYPLNSIIGTREALNSN
jgi:hypothetical protein